MIESVAVASSRHGGRLFCRVDERPYRRADGSMTALVVWRGLCVACLEPFYVMVPESRRTAGALKASGHFATVHCPAHQRRPPTAASLARAAELAALYGAVP